ncbi:hypothetical protein MRX96_014909 [Rhipicephalus microplus]
MPAWPPLYWGSAPLPGGLTLQRTSFFFLAFTSHSHVRRSPQWETTHDGSRGLRNGDRRWEDRIITASNYSVRWWRVVGSSREGIVAPGRFTARLFFVWPRVRGLEGSVDALLSDSVRACANAVVASMPGEEILRSGPSSLVSTATLHPFITI